MTLPPGPFVAVSLIDAPQQPTFNKVGTRLSRVAALAITCLAVPSALPLLLRRHGAPFCSIAPTLTLAIILNTLSAAVAATTAATAAASSASAAVAAVVAVVEAVVLLT